MWFVGDVFLEKSFGRFLQNPNMESSFIRSNYAITAFTGYEKWNKSYVARVRNSIVRGINDSKGVLPRYIVFVLDGELCESITFKGFGYTIILKRLVQWLCCQINRAIREIKDLLPSKSKRRFEPQIIWIEAPEHEEIVGNGRRIKFNSFLHEVCELYQEMTVSQNSKGVEHHGQEPGILFKELLFSGWRQQNLVVN